MTAPDQSPRSRNQALDVFRGAAILIVLGRHLFFLPPDLPLPVDLFFKTWIRFGWAGVDLFFVLSGFLVSGLLFQEFKQHGHVDVTRFFIRRGFKIYPAFYVFLLTGIVVLYALKGPLTARNVLGEALFLQNYLGKLFNQTWSLAVEEHFYLLLGATIWLSSKRHAAAAPLAFIPALFAMVAVLAFAARCYFVSRVDPWTMMFATHFRIDSLFFGVWLSHLFHFRREQLFGFVNTHRRTLRLASVFAIAPCLFLAAEDSIFMRTVGFTLVYMGFGGMLITTLVAPPARDNVCRRSLAFIGFYSYSIYLWHGYFLSAGNYLSRALPRPVPFGWHLLIYLAGAISGGALMAKLIEVPMLRLRDRHFPARARDTVVPDRSPREPASSMEGRSAPRGGDVSLPADAVGIDLRLRTFPRPGSRR
jgi:peptidoglycan/LPS O-acetylase OafA/YrhL